MTTFFGELKRTLDGENVKRKGLEREQEKAWRERKRQGRKHKKNSVVLTDNGAYNLLPIANIAA